ncbi:MAG TPA: ABC transporter ATP-binding protein [Tepidisphaeraceae bacterium]|nr:ABC transporter ATP-binding protein [Tepidisphaeraceae bacterium]
MNAPVIHIAGLSHSYGSRIALSDFSIDVQGGEIFAFLGPNGSGKTTLFRVLSTLIPPQSGTVRILNLDLPRDTNQIRPQIAVVFQSPSLDKQLTAEENLRHHGHLYGLRGRDLTNRIDESLSRFNLADRRKELVSTFSGGLRRRVELAKGLLTRPQILLMDEPSTGLDPVARLELWTALSAARQQQNLTILLTTHLMDEADKCDRLAILDRGKLIALGTPAELKQQIGGDIITLTTPDPTRLAAVLSEKFQIEPQLIDSTIRFEKQSAHEFVPMLIKSVPDQILTLSISKPTLEDVFIRLTGHRLASD